jgi:dienelactone hydrolase
MRKFFKNIWGIIFRFLQKITPGNVAWKGADKSIILSSAVIWIITSLLVFVIQPRTSIGLIPVVLGLGLGFLVSAGFMLALRILNLFPKKFLWVLPGTYLLTTFTFSTGNLSWQFPLLIVFFAGALGAGVYSFKKTNRADLSALHKIISGAGVLIGISGIIWGFVWLLDTGTLPDPDHINAATKSSYKANHIPLSDPSQPGPFKVKYLTYGSGKDKQRKEYGLDATIITDSIDGSRLLDNWKKLSGKLRTRYWGFDEKALPINARVWYPEGDGPFPLALIVHGNHGMQNYSDPGYEYLGELLASQGIIMASVDENFLNSSWTDLFTDGLDEENDARGWLLLEHLKYWEKWNNTTGSIFSNKIDMNNLAIMGHSRGGEAVAVAAFFNKLPFYPDDAKQKFDYNFNIKSVVAIAPVDGQYRPGEDRTPLENVNYLVIHGANDGDVQSFAGLRQYERIKFTDDESHFFKSAVYVYGANHGQFNSTWGNRDSGMPYGSLLNIDALMPEEDQQKVGQIYISAFLQSTLQSKTEYTDLFKDHRSAEAWLPSTIYLNQYEDSNWSPIANFEEDLDLSTASTGGSFSSENLSVWKEKLVGMKWGDKGTRAVHIGWDSLAYEAEIARFQFDLPNNLDLSENGMLTFELSEGNGSTYPDKERDEKLKENKNSNENSEGENNEEFDEEDEGEDEDEDDEKKAEEPIDFSIEFKDRNGKTGVIKLSDYSYLQRQLTVDVLKNKSLQSTKRSEAVYNTFFYNLKKLPIDSPGFEWNNIVRMSFVFDQSKKGLIILDNIAVSN